MKLNIHTISHPIVQYLSSITQNPKYTLNLHNQLLKQLGLFLIYETIRNWLSIHKIIIKQIEGTKKITILDPKESFIILSNTSINSSLIQETKYLLPQCHINFNRLDQEIINELIHLNKHREKTKIIIVTSSIDYDYIISTLHNLTNNYNIHIKQIRLACINCETRRLLEISKQYPKLNIFTTKIIHTT